MANEQEGGRLSNKLRQQVLLILRLASIGAYNARGELRDSDGNYVEGTDILKLLDHAFTTQKYAPGEELFISLLRRAKVDPNSIVNERMRDALKTNQDIDEIDSSFTHQPTAVSSPFAASPQQLVSPPPRVPAPPTPSPQVDEEPLALQDAGNATFTTDRHDELNHPRPPVAQLPLTPKSSRAPSYGNRNTVITRRIAPAASQAAKQTVQKKKTTAPRRPAAPTKTSQASKVAKVPVVSDIVLRRRQLAEQKKGKSSQRGFGYWMTASDSE